ncbi:MAG: hypothetical protein VW443_12775 [Pseudomonadales bacterium]
MNWFTNENHKSTVMKITELLGGGCATYLLVWSFYTFFIAGLIAGLIVEIGWGESIAQVFSVGWLFFAILDSMSRKKIK